MSRNKAPGLDEWRVYEMRAWPIHLHEAAASLLEEVEQTVRLKISRACGTLPVHGADVRTSAYSPP